ncbi:LysR family transcriptional regulator ArgP [Rathayibacter sp. YIM 133350]|uniref:LysR family transcriptional regulator ArgP n=1 Tax=Rathayibacter sp. YIM 133350 TaxID=3131992 RepID=UPI00307E7D17
MTVPLDLARTLVAVIDAGTLDAAAQRLRITPSAVSQRLKALEQQLGQVVLVRSKPVQLTDAGAAVVRLARQVALLEHDALGSLGLSDEGVATIPLAVNADSLGTWILPALARVAARHPVAFDLRREDQDYTAQLLERGEVMAAVTSREQPVSGCTSTFLGAMRYRPVATPDFVEHWLAHGPTAAALAGAPVVFFDRRDDLQAQALRAMGVGDAVPPTHYVPASNDFARAVTLGLGWGMLPDAQCERELADGRLVEFVSGRAVHVPLYWQQWNLRSELLSAVADELAAEARLALVR